MLNVMYPNINAKLHGMYAKKLKKSDLDELLKQNNTTQIIALMKNFNDDFRELQYDSKRIKIKILLDDILINDIIKISRLLNKKDKEVFLKFISVYEIKCIKSVFRHLISNNMINEQTNEVKNWVNKIFKKIIQIQNVKDYEDLKNVLKKTEYHSVLTDNIEPDRNSVFKIENSLDKLYFQNFMSIAKRYNNNLKDIIGKQIDLNNIGWIYRVKQFYHFSDKEVKNILININYNLKKSETNELVNSDIQKEMKDILSRTYYAQYIDFSNLEDLEENIDRYLYNLYRKYFNKNMFDIVFIYAYINMLEAENNDIMNIVEGIRYELPKEEIRKKLIR